MIKTVSTPSAPAAIGPYSQAKQTGNLLFTSGQIPLDPATGTLVGTEFAAFNEVYASFITSAPARSCFAVKALPKGALVEVEVIAEVE